MKFELQNIFELKKKERQKTSAFTIDDLFFDVFFEQLQIFSKVD